MINNENIGTSFPLFTFCILALEIVLFYFVCGCVVVCVWVGRGWWGGVGWGYERESERIVNEWCICQCGLMMFQ